MHITRTVAVVISVMTCFMMCGCSDTNTKDDMKQRQANVIELHEVDINGTPMYCYHNGVRFINCLPKKFVDQYSDSVEK